MGTGHEGRGCRLAHVDQPVVEDDDDGFRRKTRPRAIQAIELFQERIEVGAALGSACVHNELAGGEALPLAPQLHSHRSKPFCQIK